ncbi:hypothetical protein G5I_06666 [Acromyrmex echinatior]|uniref:Uncharacterized protein n=1 Tax=Acromyrmex echinatior TaxID=103372 RepID=F4WLP0_ACREC|nr:hypothetical protein G5I_06666 [Acromyrmex echinatior]
MKILIMNRMSFIRALEDSRYLDDAGQCICITRAKGYDFTCRQWWMKDGTGKGRPARREVGAERLRSVVAHQFARKRGAGRMRVASCERSVHVAAFVSSFPAPTPSDARAAKEEIICMTSFRLERKVFKHQETCWPPFGRHEDDNFQSSGICRGSQCPHRQSIEDFQSYRNVEKLLREGIRIVFVNFKSFKNEQSHRHLPGTLRGSLNHSHNHHHNHPHRHELPPSTYLTPPPPPPASSYITMQCGCALHSSNPRTLQTSRLFKYIRGERKICPADHVFPALEDYEKVFDMRTNQPELLVYLRKEEKCNEWPVRFASKSINLSPGCTSCSWGVLFPLRDEAPFVISDFEFLTKIEDFGPSAILKVQKISQDSAVPLGFPVFDTNVCTLWCTQRMLLPVRLNLGSEEGTSWHRVSGAKVLRDNPTRTNEIFTYIITKKGELFDLTRNDPKGDVTVVISGFAITIQSRREYQKACELLSLHVSAAMITLTKWKMDRLRERIINMVDIDLKIILLTVKRTHWGSSSSTNVVRGGGSGGGSDGDGGGGSVREREREGGKGACQLGPRRATSRVTPEFSPLLAGIARHGRAAYSGTEYLRHETRHGRPRFHPVLRDCEQCEPAGTPPLSPKLMPGQCDNNR